MNVRVKYLAAGLAAAIALTAALTPARGEEPLTQPLRDEHAVLRQHLEQVDNLVASVCSSDLALAESKARILVWTLKTEVLQHADWEGLVLYPAIDNASGLFCYPFTSPMRAEHKLIRAGTDELAGLIEDRDFDRLTFGRKADQLLGLIKAHLTVEEEVLFPVLDEAMSPYDFQHEILDKLPEEEGPGEE
jgi:hemerythrin-like domain-containing protein